MKRIAIIDDRHEKRDRVRDRLNLELENLNVSNIWEAIGEYPLENLDEYVSWMDENEIGFFIIDELLHEEPRADGTSTEYRGHNLVDFLRGRFPDLPIFIVTEHPHDPDLQERFKSVDDIISRNDFHEKAPEYAQRFIRYASKFARDYEEDLSFLTTFSEKVANNESVSPEEVQRANAIRAKFEMSYDIQSLITREEWLDRFEKQIAEYDSLAKELEATLNKKS